MDRRAVSPLIGFILMLAIIMGFIGIVQSKFVPEWNKAVEAKHLDRLSYEVADLSEAVSLAASTGNPAKVILDAGVSYPNYYVLLSPSKAASTITSKKLKVIVETTTRKLYTTSAIVVEPNYLYSSSPKLVFEHSAVLKVENSKVVADSDQNSFAREKITIYLINATLSSMSTTENINLVFYPISYGGTTHYDSLTITFESYDEETAKWWENELNSLGFSVTRNGENVTVRASDVDLSINYLMAFATAAGEVKTNVRLSPVHLKPLLNDSTTYRISAGEVKEFGVAVLDEYMNPIRDVDELDAVSVSADCGSCNVYYNPNGEVWCSFTAGDSACSGSVRFSLGSESVEYDVEVVKPATGGGIFDIIWSASSPYNWNVSAEGTQKTFGVTVKYAGNPVAYAPVYFSTDNTTVVSFTPTSTTTNTDGEATLTVYAKDDGTANLIAISGGSTSILELIISGAGGGFCPAGWQYWREITITNTGSALTDYQIKIELDSSNFDFTHANSDGSDIRFYDSDRVTPLSYWIEEWDYSGRHAIVWVKVPSIPSGSKTIYMLYGNPLASSESDGNAVFDFFDDFSTWSGWEMWGFGNVYSDTYSGEKVLRKDDYCDPNGGYKLIGTTLENFRLLVKDGRNSGYSCRYDRFGLENSNFNGYGIIREAYTSSYGDFGWEIRVSGISWSIYYSSSSVYQPYGNWYITELIRYENKITAKIYDENGNLIGVRGPDTIPGPYRYSNLDRFVVRGGIPYYLDWVAVAKYIEPEPTVNIGDEQSC